MPLERQTERMLVRRLHEGDRDEWVRISTASEELVTRWNPSRPAGASWEMLFARMLARSREGTCLRFAGFLPDGRIAGLYSLNEIVFGAFQNAYAGWSANAEVAGQGFATEGVQALLSLAFGAAPDGIGLHRVQANIVPRNTRSLRVAQKCGFRYEGLALQYLEINGVWEDHAMFAVTAGEQAGAG